LAQQFNAPGFEVIIVDDGSKQDAPECIGQWSTYYPLRLVTQVHAGIPAARNRGVQLATGAMLLFTDADCRLQSNCLAALAATVAKSPQQNCFQLHLVGDCSRLTGKAEELRLITLQNHLLQQDGRLRYLNTAGFAIRRSSIDRKQELFHPLALRGEDTLLLLELMDSGELPLFVRDAIVEHAVTLSLFGCFVKDLRSAYLVRSAEQLINKKRMRIRATPGERLGMLCSMWKTAGQQAIGRLAWFVAVARQLLQRILSNLFRIIGSGVANSRGSTPIPGTMAHLEAPDRPSRP